MMCVRMQWLGWGLLGQRRLLGCRVNFVVADFVVKFLFEFEYASILCSTASDPGVGVRLGDAQLP
eukprot:2097196-Rhodomonas_salina.1